MLVQLVSRRWAAVLVSMVALMLLLVACGSDPEPTATSVPIPTATPVPEPTNTPEPSPTRASEPTAEPAPPQGMTSLEDLVITGATTFGDLMGLLSEQEVSCVETGVGADLYQLILGIPIMAMAQDDISQSAPLFDCLEQDSALFLAVAFLDLQAGGWDPESRSCITEVGLTHPDAVYVRLGLNLGGDPIDPATTMDYNIRIFDCLSNDEKKRFTVGMWMALDTVSKATGADIFGLLTDEESACVGDALPAEQLAAIANATPLQAITIGSSASGCISKETNVNILTSGIEWAIGEVTGESHSCLLDFARDNPDYVELFTSGLDGIMAMPADEFVEVTAAGNEQYGCMTDDEMMRVQHSVTAALAAPPTR